MFKFVGVGSVVIGLHVEVVVSEEHTVVVEHVTLVSDKSRSDSDGTIEDFVEVVDVVIVGVVVEVVVVVGVVVEVVVVVVVGVVVEVVVVVGVEVVVFVVIALVVVVGIVIGSVNGGENVIMKLSSVLDPSQSLPLTLKRVANANTIINEYAI